MKSPRLERLTDVPAPPVFGREPERTAGVRPEVVSYSEDRRSRGLRALNEITGGAGTTLLDQMRDIAPDFADWVVDFSYADVMSRPGLDRRTRQLAGIAALTTLGNVQPQLRIQIQAALNVGCHPQEIVEVILQMAVYAGFPAAINALQTARTVLKT